MDDKITVDNHKHCAVCEKPISPDVQFCSPECKHTALKHKRAQRTTTWTLVGIVIFLLVIFVLVSGI